MRSLHALEGLGWQVLRVTELLADKYFTDDKWGQPALCLHLAPLATAKKDELFTKVKALLERIRDAGGSGGEDATNALASLHFESSS